MARGSITLSRKHGINPSLFLCPVCKKDMYIALNGRLKGDVEAPRTIEGNELCPDCKKKYVTIIEVESKDNPIVTGRRGFVPKEAIDIPLKDNIALMEEKEFTKFVPK